MIQLYWYDPWVQTSNGNFSFWNKSRVTCVSNFLFSNWTINDKNANWSDNLSPPKLIDIFLKQRPLGDSSYSSFWSILHPVTQEEHHRYNGNSFRNFVQFVVDFSFIFPFTLVSNVSGLLSIGKDSHLIHHKNFQGTDVHVFIAHDLFEYWLFFGINIFLSLCYS